MIARISSKFPIEIDRTENELMIPEQTVSHIIVTKKSIKVFLENPSIIALINKFDGYYYLLYISDKLVEYNRYYFVLYPQIQKLLDFYYNQFIKYIKKK